MGRARLLADLEVKLGTLVLRSPEVDDIEPLLRAYSDDFDLRPARQQRDAPEDFRAWMRERITLHHQPASTTQWKLELIVEHEPGVVLGWATLEADSFVVDRTVESNSWVEPGSRGQGHGTTIRWALLSLAFDGLRAVKARSRAEPSNQASNRVSEKCGYSDAGFGIADLSDGTSVTYLHWELERAGWASSSVRAELRGVAPFADWLD